MARMSNLIETVYKSEIERRSFSALLISFWCNDDRDEQRGIVLGGEKERQKARQHNTGRHKNLARLKHELRSDVDAW
jgi:hypothetical protein